MLQEDTFSKADVLAQVDTICASETFDGQTRLQKLFRYLVEKFLKNEVPTETDIAVDVLNRRARDFHPRTDAGVRVAMVNLRKRLDAYNSNEGSDTARLVIEIPKGGFIPTIAPNWPLIVENFGRQTILPNEAYWAWLYENGPIPGIADATSLLPANLAPIAYSITDRRILAANVDNDGNLNLPTAIVNFFDALNNRRVVVGSLDGVHGRIYPAAVWILVETVLQDIALRHLKRADGADIVFGRAEIDSQGRVPLPQYEGMRCLRFDSSQTIWVRFDARAGCIHFWAHTPGQPQQIAPDEIVF